MFDVRPGVTGWAQIHGRKDIMWVDRIEMGVYYAENVSLLLDLRIFFTTIWKVLSNADNENKGVTVEKKSDPETTSTEIAVGEKPEDETVIATTDSTLK